MNRERFTELLIPLDGDEFTPTREQELLAIERAYQERIPEDFRLFTAQFGAVMFSETIEIRSLSSLPREFYLKDVHSIGIIYGGSEDEDRRLTGVQRVWGDRIPKSLLPIAGDIHDSQICLGMSGSQRGRIYLWNAEAEMDEEEYRDEHGDAPPGWELHNVHLLAESFDSLIEQMDIED